LTDKTALRIDLAARREAAARADPDAAARLAAMFPEDLVPGRLEHVAGYIRFRSEIDPAPLMARLAARGCMLSLPRTPDTATETLRFHSWQPGKPLRKSRFGVMEPLHTAHEVSPALILVPLLGFDARLHRLGYGKGHYDRVLAARGTARAVGLAYAAQEVDLLPTEPHDIALDAVVTPDFVYRRRLD
jgi:5-formyltetrahydrofolate cyclo-ligase